jgi:hypothetical protein
MPGFAGRQAGISRKAGQSNEYANLLKLQGNIFEHNRVNINYFNILSIFIQLSCP